MEYVIFLQPVKIWSKNWEYIHLSSRWLIFLLLLVIHLDNCGPSPSLDENRRDSLEGWKQKQPLLSREYVDPDCAAQLGLRAHGSDYGGMPHWVISTEGARSRNWEKSSEIQRRWEQKEKTVINKMLEQVLDADNGAESESLQICTTQCLIRLDLFIASGIEWIYSSLLYFTLTRVCVHVCVCVCVCGVLSTSCGPGSC